MHRFKSLVHASRTGGITRPIHYSPKSPDRKSRSGNRNSAYSNRSVSGSTTASPSPKGAKRCDPTPPVSYTGRLSLTPNDYTELPKRPQFEGTPPSPMAVPHATAAAASGMAGQPVVEPTKSTNRAVSHMNRSIKRAKAKSRMFRA